MDCVTMQKCPLGIRQWVLHEQISIGRLHKACQGGNLRQYVTFTYHLSWLANTCTWYVEYAYKIVSHTILCRKMRSISQRERQTHNYWQLTTKITLLAPKLLLNYLWPMITIQFQTHPILQSLFNNQNRPWIDPELTSNDLLWLHSD